MSKIFAVGYTEIKMSRKTQQIYDYHYCNAKASILKMWLHIADNCGST